MTVTIRDKSAQTVVEFAIETIKSGIYDGRFAPGQRLIEADLTRDLAISRGPVREALRRLAADGIVELISHRGAVVARPSRAEVAGLFDAREALEALAARRAAELIDEAGNRALAQRARAEMQGSRDQLAVDAYVRENQRFHEAILALAGNIHLHRLLAQLEFPAFRASFFRVFDEAERAASLAEHGAIIGAIIDGQPKRAEDAMRKHVRRAARLAQRLPDSLFRS
ncbi:MAG TPA: GntR family transcriptional regulator [Alphaproteobacteria bacterium]|jgi:DNA-binding GntR family transcriptional regulator|nr:GntR family transcriptional regulator [Alphaproteobacteria bacterium]